MKVAKFFKIILLVVFLCIAIYVGVFNNTAVVFQMSPKLYYRVPLYVVIIGSFLTGVLVTWLYLMISVIKNKVQIISLTKKLKQVKEDSENLDAAKSETKAEDEEEKIMNQNEEGQKDL